ncbi:MAG TPA: xanthine dehydrogenase family protein molybdopterin-binding subunit [Methylomirabilota bacterium]|jgi:isoquinoline 1-oxidoreductase beta subunit|nr:xanthine dehydrogenase family protein molybdopterin-binding subunit [Methylomirabilota bacterium]
MKTAMTTLSRRALLKGGLAAGAGLAIGFRLPLPAADLAEGQAGTFAPNQWLRIDLDGVVTITNSVPEMGQGSLTTMPMIIADELDADWNKIKVEQAPANPKLYANPVTGAQSYGGSRGVRDHLQMWRKAGAAARQMLMQAAANEWAVKLEEIDTEPGVVTHKGSGRRLAYGQLVDKAAQLPVPQDPKLKTPDKFRYIGKGQPRLDTRDKVNGSAMYGIDVQVPGMLIASIERCPVFGGKLQSFDATATNVVPGVKQVTQVSNGVAVVADNFWSALQGRKALKVTWDEGPHAQLSSARITRDSASLAKQPGQVARRDGDVEKVLAAGGKTIESVYQVPFLEHACMEPMNTTAHVTKDACVIWSPTQNPGGTQATGARITGLPPEKVTVHTTLLGGGFGRRSELDFIVDAVEASKATGAPVKVMWTREDDIQHGFYRPATYNVFRAALDQHGMPAAWRARIVGPGILIQKGRAQAGTIDATAVEAVRNFHYDIPNVQVEWTNTDHGVPIGFWRAVGTSQNAYIVESFIDELAHLAGQDPYEYRRALLGKSPRLKAVLDLAAAKGTWGAPLPAGRARGIAVAFAYGSYVAHVAEVSVAEGKVRVHKLTSAIDCGLAVNPDQVIAQMEGSAIYALTAALYGEITIDNGRVQQSNFHDYPLLRMNEAPAIEVHLIDSREAPGGIGQPGVPTVAPAVCNAVYALTGKRIRSLPIRFEELKRA